MNDNFVPPVEEKKKPNTLWTNHLESVKYGYVKA